VHVGNELHATTLRLLTQRLVSTRIKCVLHNIYKRLGSVLNQFLGEVEQANSAALIQST